MAPRGTKVSSYSDTYFFDLTASRMAALDFAKSSAILFLFFSFLSQQMIYFKTNNPQPYMNKNHFEF